MSVLLSLAQPTAQICESAAECANQGVDNFVGTPRRIWATVAAFVALVGVLIGGLALRRSRRGIGNAGRRGSIVALAAGATGAVNGAANLTVATGGLGTGNGVAGGAIALVLGLLAAFLGWRASTHTRPTERVS